MSCNLNAAIGGNGMGIGRLGDDSIIHKRKFRWTFEIQFGGKLCGGFVPASFVKTAARPEITIEETEINFLNEKLWIPGKAVWEPITITYYDVNSSENTQLLSWLASVYDFTDDTCRHMNAKRSEYSGIGTLKMLDGCGQPMEKWTYGDMWPTSIKFGDLDYAVSEVSEIEITLRYSKVKFTNLCGKQPVRCKCSHCK